MNCTSLRHQHQEAVLFQTMYVYCIFVIHFSFMTWWRDKTVFVLLMTLAKPFKKELHIFCHRNPFLPENTSSKSVLPKTRQSIQYIVVFSLPANCICPTKQQGCPLVVLEKWLRKRRPLFTVHYLHLPTCTYHLSSRPITLPVVAFEKKNKPIL